MLNRFFVAVVVLMFFSFLMPSHASATAQIGERLIYNGEKHTMFSCPNIPQNDPRIRKLSNEEIQSKDFSKSIIFSTACWRQYLGTWEIKDRRLYLIEIIGTYELVGKEAIFADWFSGELRIPMGKRIKYVHMGFSSIYEKDIIMQIKDGILLKTKTINNKKKVLK